MQMSALSSISVKCTVGSLKKEINGREEDTGWTGRHEMELLNRQRWCSPQTSPSFYKSKHFSLGFEWILTIDLVCVLTDQSNRPFNSGGDIEHFWQGPVKCCCPSNADTMQSEASLAAAPMFPGGKSRITFSDSLLSLISPSIRDVSMTGIDLITCTIHPWGLSKCLHIMAPFKWSLWTWFGYICFAKTLFFFSYSVLKFTSIVSLHRWKLWPIPTQRWSSQNYNEQGEKAHRNFC